jgi:hypothetical protein
MLKFSYDSANLNHKHEGFECLPAWSKMQFRGGGGYADRRVETVGFGLMMMMGVA